MILNDQQLGAPGVLYKDTKANIEALTVVEGAFAYATDTNQIGSYDGAAWTWGATPTAHGLVSAYHTASGLTVGQVLRATAADAFGFGALDLANANAVTGALPIANGGTGATTALGAFNAVSPLTTRGDLLTRDASNNVRLPLGGIAGSVLTRDANDVVWSAGKITLPAGADLVMPAAKIELLGGGASCQITLPNEVTRLPMRWRIWAGV